MQYQHSAPIDGTDMAALTDALDGEATQEVVPASVIPRPNIRQRVLALLRGRGSMTTRMISRCFNGLKREELQECLAELIDEGFVKIQRDGRRLLFYVEETDPAEEREITHFEESIRRFLQNDHHDFDEIDNLDSLRDIRNGREV